MATGEFSRCNAFLFRIMVSFVSSFLSSPFFFAFEFFSLGCIFFLGLVSYLPSEQLMDPDGLLSKERPKNGSGGNGSVLRREILLVKSSSGLLRLGNVEAEYRTDFCKVNEISVKPHMYASSKTER